MQQMIHVVHGDGRSERIPRRELTGQRLEDMAASGAEFFCMCTVMSLVRMYKHGSGIHARLHRNPGTCHEHADDCDSYDIKPAHPAGNGASRRRSSIEVTERGIDAKLNLPLWSATEARAGGMTPNTTIRKGGSTKDVERGSTTLAGLLHCLLDQGGLNEHNPFKSSPEDWAGIASRLRSVVGKTRVNHRRLDEVMLLPQYANQSAIEGMVASRATSTSPQSENYLLVLGELIGLDDLAEEVSLRLDFSSLVLNASKESWRHGIETAAYPIEGIETLLRQMRDGNRNRNARILVFARVKSEGVQCRNGRRFPTVRIKDLSLTVVSPQGIRVESGYELSAVSHAVRQQRHFRKLTFPPIGLAFIPDLLFLDCFYPTVFEIFGVKGDKAYDDRAKRKIPAFNAFYGSSTIGWYANRGESMPPFPPKAA